MDNNYLMHYGILGQKWGVRRFQNPDGSLTAKGKARQERAEARAERKQIRSDARAEKKRQEAADRATAKRIYKEMENRTKNESKELYRVYKHSNFSTGEAKRVSNNAAIANTRQYVQQHYN